MVLAYGQVFTSEASEARAQHTRASACRVNTRPGAKGRVSGILCKSLSIKLLMAFSLFENSIDEPPVIPGRHGTATEKGQTGSFLRRRSRVARCVGARVAFPGKLQPREWSYGESSCSRLAGW